MKTHFVFLFTCAVLFACKKREGIPTVSPSAGQLRLVEQMDSIYNPSGDWTVITWKFYYDDQGRITHEEYYQAGSSPFSAEFHYQNGWLSAGKAASPATSGFHEDDVIIRDTKHQIVSDTSISNDQTYFHTYEYDLNGNLIKMVQSVVYADWVIRQFTDVNTYTHEYSEFVNNRWTKDIQTFYSYSTIGDTVYQKNTLITKRLLDINGFEIHLQYYSTVDRVDTLPNKQIQYTRLEEDSSMVENQFFGLTNGAQTFLNVWQNIHHSYYSSNDDVILSPVPLPTLQDQISLFYPHLTGTPYKTTSTTVTERNYYGLPTRVITQNFNQDGSLSTRQAQITKYRYEGN